MALRPCRAPLARSSPASHKAERCPPCLAPMVLCTRAVQLGLQRPSRSGSGVEYDLLAYLDILILF